MVFKHRPLKRFGPSAVAAATAADCAHRQGLFWRMHDHLFSDYLANRRGVFEDEAMSIGLDMDEFVACQRRSESPAVVSDAEEADRLGIVSTPTFLFALSNDSGGSARIVDRLVGVRTYNDIANRLEQFLSP